MKIKICRTQLLSALLPTACFTTKTHPTRVKVSGQKWMSVLLFDLRKSWTEVLKIFIILFWDNFRLFILKIYSTFALGCFEVENQAYSEKTFTY